MEQSAADTADTNSSTGTYILRDLIKDLPLSTDDNDVQAHITCVDAWSDNLYIGTSAGEVLHYVSIPADPADPSSEASYIFASRLEPPFTTPQEGRDAGVKQILLLPDAGKASILCNGTVTFYTLPELSPAYGGKIQQAGCTWVGGLDSDRNGDMREISGADPVIVLCLRQKLRLIRISGRNATKVRDIELGDVLAIQRRGDLACVANGTMYSLLDVVNHRKNDLFQISSLSATDSEPPSRPEPPRSSSHGASRSVSTTAPFRQAPTHERNVSFDSQWPARGSSRQRPASAQTPSREDIPAQSAEPHAAPPETSPRRQPVVHPLPPNIVSPSPTEFLLTTGTQLSEPGVGLVINADGDPSGGTLDFSSYPESLVLDGFGPSGVLDTPAASETDGYVLAIVRRQVGHTMQKGVEIQQWNSDEAQRSKEWLPIQSLERSDDDVEKQHAGLRVSTSATQLAVPEIGTSLRQRRLYLNTEASEADGRRNDEEDKFAARFNQTSASVLLYTNDRVRWVMKNPLLLQLERQLGLAVQRSNTGELLIDVLGIQQVINSIRGQDARDELEFVTLTYIRQKASLILFGNLMLQTARGVVGHELERRFADEALVAGDIDPRVILSLVPNLSEEVQEGQQGIWISQGLRDTISILQQSFDKDNVAQDLHGPYGSNILNIVKRYLFTWRQKKGFGSVADEALVFQSVDAALLHVLLLLDQDSPRGPAIAGSVRAELNDLVDRDVDCFDRAVELFTQFERLYMLSRLYQKRKMVGQVLATWKQVLEGEVDVGGELIDGEHDLRRYLTKIRDPALVQEYGSWLANRNPALGVQVFADESSRVKFEPAEAVAILKEKAPGAVKDYLEHLVFDKNHVSYVNDLIAYYLDTVLAELNRSDGSTKHTLVQSYETYRALRPPKPTYRQFITDNVIDAEWWHNRLRLLQLIGGSHGAASKYDVHSLRERLAPYSEELVPEMIILNGREGKHEEALRLLTHGLGDHDTAIRYCLLGGSSIFHPSSGRDLDQPVPSKEEQGRLFEYLLHEFFRIEDLGERLERTAELLERFGGWFDIAKVLDLIPDGWSVELVSGFLIHALRSLIRERNETVVVKALASAQNLKRSVEVVEQAGSMGPTVMSDDLELVVR